MTFNVSAFNTNAPRFTISDAYRHTLFYQLIPIDNSIKQHYILYTTQKLILHPAPPSPNTQYSQTVTLFITYKQNDHSTCHLVKTLMCLTFYRFFSHFVSCVSIFVVLKLLDLLQPIVKTNCIV